MAFISKLTDYIIKNYSNNLTDDSLTIVFPNKRAALTLRNELMKRIERNIWLPQILSIEEVISSWSGLQLLDNIDVIYELIRIMNHNNMDVSTRKNIFPLASQIVKDFDEIDQYAVDAEHLFKYLKSVKEVETWSPDTDELTQTESAYLIFFKSLYSYYTELRKTLLDEKSAYYGLMTRTLYELSDEQLQNIIGDRKIIFAGFNAMTRTEENLIVRIVESGKGELFWDLDKYYYDDELQEAGLFARQFFGKHKNLKLNNIEDNFSLGEKQINIIAAAGSTIQTNALQINLSEELKNNKHSKNEVVVLSDENLLIPVLNSIPHNYRDIKVTMGYPYSETFLNQLILLIFPFQNTLSNKDSNIYFWSLKRLLETEMIKVIFSNEELKSLNRCLDKFAKESTYYLKINDIENILNPGHVLDFIKIITHKWESSHDCISSIKSLLNLIEVCVSSTNNYFVVNQISVAGKIFNKIEKLIRKYELIVQIDDIETLYKQSAAEMSIKFISKESKNSDSSLQIMGLLETRNLDFETVHILSVNEGILPQSKTPNSLIPYDLRLEYKLPIHTNKQAVYAYHFYRLIQNAKTVNIYYSTLTDDVGQGEPSRFIRQLINEIPHKSKNITINEITYKLPSPQNDEVVPIEVRKTPEILERIKNKLYSIRYNNELGCEEKFGLSPTSISCYLSCPIKFYIKYIENVKDDTPEETIQVNIIGSIIHSTFEFLYKKFNGIVDEKYYNIVVEKYQEEAFQNALKENNFANGLPETGFNYLNQIMIKELIDNFINYEKSFYKKGNSLTVKGLEEKLVHTFDIDKNTKVNLTGFADRIDQIGNKVRILDYKTGKVEDKDVEIKSDNEDIMDLTEKSLQLCIYKYLYKKKFPEISTENIEPGIFGLLKVSEPYFPLVIDSDIFKDDTFMDTFEEMFINLFKEILDPEIPFRQTDDEKKCSHCDYVHICKRNPKTW